MFRRATFLRETHPYGEEEEEEDLFKANAVRRRRRRKVYSRLTQ